MRSVFHNNFVGPYFALLKHSNPIIDPSLRLSLVTFGAPPVTSPCLTPIVNQCHSIQNEPGIVVAVVNEQDPIPRAEKNYLLSLLEIYQDDEHPNPPSSGQTHIIEAEPIKVTSKHWESSLPPTMHPMGNIIILKNRNMSEEDLDLCAGQLSLEAFERLLFCDARKHRKAMYLARIEKMRVGQYRDLAA